MDGDEEMEREKDFPGSQTPELTLSVTQPPVLAVPLHPLLLLLCCLRLQLVQELRVGGGRDDGLPVLTRA